MITCDHHIHSSISPDGKASMEEMCEAAIGKGMKEVAFTDHYECYYGGIRGRYFDRDYLKRYFRELEKCRQKYDGRLVIRAGVELGQSHLDNSEAEMVRGFPFDYILGSVHKLGNVDLAWIRLTDINMQGIADTYYAEMKRLSMYGIYDCLGHLDYIKKHCARCGVPYDEERYFGIMEKILRNVICRGKGIEVNTACMGTVLEETMPDMPVLKLYRELGGKIVKTGSDAHTPERIGYGFEKAEERIKRSLILVSDLNE